MAKIATVPKNIREIKSKFMFGLTIRQLCCFGLAGAAGIPVYFALRQFVGNDLATIVMVAVMFPFFFVALYEKDGMPAERILYLMLMQRFVRPGIRRYRTEEDPNNAAENSRQKTRHKERGKRIAGHRSKKKEAKRQR